MGQFLIISYEQWPQGTKETYSLLISFNRFYPCIRLQAKLSSIAKFQQERQSSMNTHSHLLSQRIVRQLVTELASFMPEKATALNYSLKRNENIKQKSVEFVKSSIAELSSMYFYRPHKDVINSQYLDRPESRQREGVRHIKKIVGASIKKFEQSPNEVEIVKKRTRIIRKDKENRSQLIKLNTEEDEGPSSNFIDRLRQRKIKYDEALEKFREQDIPKPKPVKTALNNFLTDREKTFITNLEGERVKIQRKELKSKKDELYQQKTKIKPNFRIKQIDSKIKKGQFSKAEVFGELASLERLETEEQVEEDRVNIKSIAELLTSKTIEGGRRRRRNLL